MKKRDYVAPKYSNFEGIRTYILKVASRCNLNCSYCYMYNMGDDSYINQPKFIDMETVRQFAYRLKNHAKAYSLKTVSIAFHGGEPLLWGLKNIIEAKNIILNIISSAVNTDVQFAIQTNGVLLNENVIASLVQNNIYIGISLDGLKKTHDKYRIDFKKKGSFDAIIKNVHSLKKHQKYLSILTVMNLEIDPEEYYDFLIKLKSTTMNIPKPYFRSMHSIVMDRIDGIRLIEMKKLENPRQIFYQVFEQIRIAYKENIINGDLSEYNILLDGNNDVWIIDWPQAVTLEHPNAEFLIRRDLRNIIRYFTRKYDLNLDENTCYNGLLK